jgi:hypothetical protein
MTHESRHPKATAPAPAVHCSGRLGTIAAELGWSETFNPNGLLFMGACPTCGGEAFAWDVRHRRPDDSWSCVRCSAGGDLFDLWARWHRTRSAA